MTWSSLPCACSRPNLTFPFVSQALPLVLASDLASAKTYTQNPCRIARVDQLTLGKWLLFQGIPRAAAFADLRQVAIPGQLFYMHFDGVAVRPRRLFDFLDRDFAARLSEIQNLARKRW